MKLKRFSNKPKPSVRKATIAARTILAVTLLLTLVAGSIVLPAAAAGPTCTLTCCAGRAPHAAGSCLHGSCQAGVPVPSPAGDKAQNSHLHHQVQTAQESEASDRSQPFPGAVASAGAGSETGEIPSIEAEPYEAPHESAEISTKATRPSISAAVLSKPCQPACRLCASGFVTPKRSRNNALAARSNHTPPTLSTNVAEVEPSLKAARAAQGFKCAPRGPPPHSS